MMPGFPASSACGLPSFSFQCSRYSIVDRTDGTKHSQRDKDTATKGSPDHRPWPERPDDCEHFLTWYYFEQIAGSDGEISKDEQDASFQKRNEIFS